MRAAIIINPISGRRTRRTHDAGDRESVLRAWLKAQPIDAEIATTNGEGHGAALSRAFAARGFDRVVAWGGDGTANEVAGPLVGSAVTFGLVRSGSGDGLGRSLQLPIDPTGALALALTAPPRPIDVGWLGARHFLSVAGIGFDAAVACAFNRRSVRGPRGYFLEGLRTVLSYRASRYDLDLDGRRSAGPYFLIAFANGHQYGNGFILSHDADIRDGLLDVVAVTDGSLWQQLWRGRRLVFGTDRPARGVLRSR